MNTKTRFDALNNAIEEDRVIRWAWRLDADRACLLITLAPELYSPGMTYGDAISRPCPSKFLPDWLVRLTPTIDDCGTAEAWPGMIRRYASAVGRAALTLDTDAWNRVYFQFLTRLLRQVGERGMTPLEHQAVEFIEQSNSLSFPPEITEALLAAKPEEQDENGENGERALFADLLYILRALLSPYDEEAKTLAQCISLCAEAILHPNDPDSALPFAWEQIAWDRVTEILFDTIEAALPPEATP